VQPRCTRGTSRSQPSTSGRWPGAPPPSSSRLGAADSASTPGFFPAARSAPCSMPSGRSGRAKTRRRRSCLRSPSAPTVASHLARTPHPSSTSAGRFPTSHHENGNSQPVNKNQANAAPSSAWPSRLRDAACGITKALELSGGRSESRAGDLRSRDEAWIQPPRPAGGEISGEGNPVATDPLPRGGRSPLGSPIPQRDAFISHPRPKPKRTRSGSFSKGRPSRRTAMATAATPTRQRRGPTPAFDLTPFGALFLSRLADSGRGGPCHKLVRRHVPLAEFDRHHAKHVFPVRLVQQDLAQLRLRELRQPRQPARLLWLSRRRALGVASRNRLCAFRADPRLGATCLERDSRLLHRCRIGRRHADRATDLPPPLPEKQCAGGPIEESRPGRLPSGADARPLRWYWPSAADDPAFRSAAQPDAPPGSASGGGLTPYAASYRLQRVDPAFRC
jgi:hypothetical protein